MVKVLTKKLCNDVFTVYKKQRNIKGVKNAKFAFLTEQIFNLVTYDEDLAVSWGKSIYEVLTAIRDQRTEEFQQIGYVHYSTFMVVAQMLNQRHWIDWNVQIRNCFLYESKRSKNFDLFFIGILPTEKFYDREGVQYSIENLKVLLDWIGE